MGDNKVSEKAIWEGSISPDNNTPSIASQMQAQPQMMFCYKCNNVIPANSKFCPCCNIELFTTCPKCGVKYSSQYSICSQCGTNRLEYLQMQRKEQERIERLKRVERIRQEELERERQEAERQKRLKRLEQQEIERKKEEAYRKENDKIMKTKEYETTYSLINEALKRFEGRCKQKRNIVIFSCIIYFLFWAIGIGNFANQRVNDLTAIIIVISTTIAIFLPFIVATYCIGNNKDAEKKVKFILRHIKKRNVGCDKHMMEYVISKIQANELVDVSKCCIEAYRIKNNLPVGYKKY